MGTPRIFTTAPSRLIADNELTALEMRVLLVVALHDGMSGVKGKGGGCYARHSNLAKLCRTDTTRFSKAVSRLIRLGYLVREPQLMDKRRFTLRVVYDEDDSWRTGLLSDGEIVDAPEKVVGEQVNPDGEIVGERDTGNGGFSRRNAEHYISLREELDSVETGELDYLERALNSSEEAHLRDASFPPEDDGQEWRVPDALRAGREAAEAERVEWTLKAHLPPNYEALPLGAQVSKLDKAFTAIGRDPGALRDDEREKYQAILTDIFETCMGGDMDATAQQALRLSEDMAVF